MKFGFKEPSANYVSGSQRARVWTEQWVSEWLYCPNCGNPEILLCIHEEAAVAIAHGWAKVTGRAMGVVLHSNVGLMHGSMGIFNAFCDRGPILVLGATGPLDAMRRRPWIEWIHTAQDQGALVRDFVKWDYQPGGIQGVPDSFARAYSIMMTEPKGPVYMCYDAALQEAPKTVEVPLPPRSRRPGRPARSSNGWRSASARATST
jgi:thiamine pyrophosphate-dependent acetolactate synthase large subunit-like protein